ncbi:MAG: hypothetical protein VW516_10435, partial [Rhodospirillaceae bacterium]
FELLESADHVLTGFSTTAIEAGYFNLDITLTGATGLELYADYIEAGLMKHAANVDELITVLHESAEKARSRQRGLRRTGPRNINLHLDEIEKHWKAVEPEVSATIERLSQTSVTLQAHDIIPKSPPQDPKIASQRHAPPPQKAAASQSKENSPSMQRIVQLAQRFLPHHVLIKLNPLARQLRLLEKRIRAITGTS